MYILRLHAAGILYATPPFIHPPPLGGYFQGLGGWGCINFGPVVMCTPYIIKKSTAGNGPGHQKEVRRMAGRAEGHTEEKHLCRGSLCVHGFVNPFFP